MPESAIAKLTITDGYLDGHEELFETLVRDVPWDRTMAARLTASFGVPYNYAQMVYPAVPMHSALVPVVAHLHESLQIQFNNCLLNYYLDERSKMGFHSDDTTALQPGTGVAIVSLGHPRRISFRRRDNPEIRKAFELQPGSLLYMENSVQDEWAHAIKRQKGVGPRISLTWRAFRTN